MGVGRGGERLTLRCPPSRPPLRDEYFRMKLQWKSVSPEQERRNSLLHGYRSLIGGSEDSTRPGPPGS